MQTPITPAPQTVGLVADRILAVIVLVKWLRRVEPTLSHDRRDNRSVEPSRQLPLRILGDAPLRRVPKEDRGMVLRPVVADLPVGIERIDVVPESVDELVVADRA